MRVISWMLSSLIYEAPSEELSLLNVKGKKRGSKRLINLIRRNCKSALEMARLQIMCSLCRDFVFTGFCHFLAFQVIKFLFR